MIAQRLRVEASKKEFLQIPGDMVGREHMVYTCRLRSDCIRPESTRQVSSCKFTSLDFSVSGR